MTLFFSILIGLLSMVSYSLAGALSKPLSHKLGVAQILFLRGSAVIVLLGIATFTSFHYFQHWITVLLTIGLGMAGYLPVLAFTKGIKNSPLGIVSPIASTSPLITVFLSFLFLKIQIRPLQWVAILLVILTNIVVSIDLKNWRQSKLFQKSSGIPYALMAALGWGLCFFLLVPATKILSPLLAAFLLEVGVTIAAGLHIKLSSQKVEFKNALSPSVMFNGILIGIGTVAFTVGVQYFNIGIIQVLSNSGALATTLLGAYLYHERLHLKERIATIMMVAGVIALFLV